MTTDIKPWNWTVRDVAVFNEMPDTATKAEIRAAILADRAKREDA